MQPLLRFYFRRNYKVVLPLLISLGVYFFYGDTLKVILVKVNSNVFFKEDKKELKRLKADNFVLSLKLKQYSKIKEENERLRKALSLKGKEDISLTMANIIYFSPTNWEKSVWINVGKNNGIEIGMYVIDDKRNVIGKITETKEGISKVTLLQDPNITIPVFVRRNIGVLKGSLSGKPQIKYIDSMRLVEAGDEVLFRHPQYNIIFPVGKVTRVRKMKDSLFLYIEVKPNYNIVDLESIFVIK